MIEVSKELTQVLSNYGALTAVVGNRIYPMVAPADAKFPFAVYGFGEVPFETKDACAYNTNVAVWFEPNSVIEAYKMADDLKELSEENDWEFYNTNVEYDPEKQKIFSEINFKIIK